MKNNKHYVIISKEPHNHLELFDRILAACDFLTLFSSVLLINNDTYFDINKLINFIDECQQKNKYLNLLNNIYVRDDKYNSFNKAIKVLKIDKDIKEIRCQHRNTIFFDHIMLINKKINLKETLTKNNKKTIAEMNNFVKEYNNYLNRDIYISHRPSAKVHARRLSHR